MSPTALWLGKVLLMLLAGGAGMAACAYAGMLAGRRMDRKGTGWTDSPEASAEMMAGICGCVGFGLGLGLAGWLLWR